MARILVTGGAGYIGAVLVPELLARDHNVHVIDNFMYGQNSLATSFMDSRFRATVGDVRDLEQMKPALAEADVIIPLAAIVGAPACQRDKSAALSSNLEAPLALLELVSDDQQVVMPTTNSAYGTTPLGEVCTEEAPLHPISLYAQHKVEVEAVLLSLPRSTSLRLATVFGMSPRMRLDLLVNDLTNRALLDRSVVLFEADFVRNYVHVRDVARAIVWAMENPATVAREVFNVGLSSANLSKRELCLAIQRHVPGFVYTEASIGKDPDQRNYIVSNAKIEAAGFTFETDLDRGINELVKGLPTLRSFRFTNMS